MLGKDEEDQLDRSCEKWRSVAYSKGGEEYHTYNKKKEGELDGQILRRNCLLKQIIEGKIGGGIEVTGKQERGCKQLPGNFS